ncbi:LOW QUALITY PROTEIN: uncharacterized protein [Primulina eburnea]|uniref:LOW QUALITY PROTEIN: uncharacterized protein n=1 Tax=Primulina eburnea TaxID=1245227 RepID=UPI003C6CBAF9
MPRSTRHKSHRRSKHGSRDYSDSEEDVKMKDKSSKDENLVKVNRDSAYGEKRKSSSQVREGREVKNMIEHENGGASENYFSSKRRKENSDFGVGVGGDRWNGGDDEIGKSDRVMENETIKGEGFKVESKSKEFSNRGESLKNKSKKYESGSTGEKKESLSSVVVEDKEDKCKTESKRKSERDYSVRKEGKESKDKDHRQEKEKESNRGGEANIADVDVAKRMGLQQVDLIVERQFKRGRENSDFTAQDESRNSDLEKEVEKKTRRRREGSGDGGKHRDVFKDGEERGFTSRNDLDKHKDEDDYKDDRQRDEKCHKETSKDNKYRDDKHRIDGEKDARRKDDRQHEDDDRENRTKDEKHREDGERGTKWTYDKYREGTERDSRNRDARRHEDGERDHRRRNDPYHEDGVKNGRHGDERYHEDGDKDRRGSNNHKEYANRDIRHKEEKHREDVERESLRNDGKLGSDFDRGKSLRESKYRDERATGDRFVDKSDLRHSIDDGYVADYHSRKSSAYNHSPSHDERTARNRDDQGVRRPNEKGDYNGIRSQSTNDQRFNAEKGGSGARIHSTPNRGRSTSKNADVEINSSHSRRHSSPRSSSLAPRDRHRLSKQDESKYGDYGYEERHRHNLISTRNYTSTVGGSEKTSLSWSMEKQDKKEDGHLGDFAERRLKSDSGSSPMQLTEKSPPTSIDRRQFSMSDVRRSIDVEESTQRSGGSRDVNEYSGKEGRGRHDSVIDMFPGNGLSLADADTLSVSSPFTRNNHLSGSSKSFPPPPNFRTGVESPLIGSAEDDSIFKSNSHRRRSGDPNMARVHGNAWRGVPSWPSPVVNGFMPFRHAPPLVNFHSVMQPFTPMFGIRPSVDMNHPAPYHIPNADRYSGPGRSMGWRNPVDDPSHPLHAWDASNASLRDESHIYGRPGWDHSRNLPDGRGWNTTGDLWKGPNRTASLDMSSSEKENKFAQNADEVSASQSIQPIWNEQNFPGPQAESSDVNQSNFGSGNNAVQAPQIPEDTSDATKTSKKDDALLCHVYLSKLDISADLTEPGLLNQCSGFCNMDQIIVSDIHDSKILYVEESGEAKVESHQILRYFLSTPKDDSVFMRAMSLYERQKDNFSKVVAGEKFSKPESHREDLDAEDNTAEKQSSTGDILSAEEAPALANPNVEVNPMNTLLKAESCTEATHEKPILQVALAMVKSEEPVSTLELSNMQIDLASNIVEQDHIVEEKHLSVECNKGFDTSLPANMKNEGIIEELNLDGTECVTLLNSDLFSDVSEAMMPESLVSGSVNLSRIHHSPESTH